MINAHAHVFAWGAANKPFQVLFLIQRELFNINWGENSLLPPRRWTCHGRSFEHHGRHLVEEDFLEGFLLSRVRLHDLLVCDAHARRTARTRAPTTPSEEIRCFSHRAASHVRYLWRKVSRLLPIKTGPWPLFMFPQKIICTVRVLWNVTLPPGDSAQRTGDACEDSRQKTSLDVWTWQWCPVECYPVHACTLITAQNTCKGCFCAWVLYTPDCKWEVIRVVNPEDPEGHLDQWNPVHTFCNSTLQNRKVTKIQIDGECQWCLCAGQVLAWPVWSRQCTLRNTNGICTPHQMSRKNFFWWAENCARTKTLEGTGTSHQQQSSELPSPDPSSQTNVKKAHGFRCDLGCSFGLHFPVEKICPKTEIFLLPMYFDPWKNKVGFQNQTLWRLAQWRTGSRWPPPVDAEVGSASSTSNSLQQADWRAHSWDSSWQRTTRKQDIETWFITATT